MEVGTERDERRGTRGTRSVALQWQTNKDNEGEKDVKLKNKDLVSCIVDWHKSVAPIFVEDFVHNTDNSCCAVLEFQASPHRNPERFSVKYVHYWIAVQ